MDDLRHTQECINAFYSDGGQSGCICGVEQLAEEVNTILREWDEQYGLPFHAALAEDIVNRLTDRLAAAKSQAHRAQERDTQREALVGLRIALENLRDHGYQPMYNGRPSCPFCGHFIDSEDRHAFGCVLDNGLDRLAAAEGQREALVDAVSEMFTDPVTSNPSSGWFCTNEIAERIRAALKEQPR